MQNLYMIVPSDVSGIIIFFVCTGISYLTSLVFVEGKQAA